FADCRAGRAKPYSLNIRFARRCPIACNRTCSSLPRRKSAGLAGGLIISGQRSAQDLDSFRVETPYGLQLQAIGGHFHQLDPVPVGILEPGLAIAVEAILDRGEQGDARRL